MSDRDLWLAALGGDAPAFTSLFDRHHLAVFRSVRRLGASHHEAEDAIAGAFLELWRRRSDVQLVDDSVYPWLVVAALNTHRNRVRSAIRHRAVLQRLHSESDEAVDAQLVAEQRLLSEHRAAALRAALKTLSAADAALVVLVDLDGQDQEQVAQMLQIRSGALRTRLHRARTRLRTDLLTQRPDLFEQEHDR